MGRLASEVGGTFTDLVYFDEDSGELRLSKALTTPANTALGVLETIKLAGIDGRQVDFFVHGGTTVINAITERKGARTALVTTQGFRDVLEIARGNRPDLYNLRFEKEPPFVPRVWRYEVGERVDARGNELVPLNYDDLAAIVERCKAEGIAAVAVVFLHSYVAPAHEVAAASFLREKLPGVTVSASCEITREWREYERASTVVLNAYVQPIIQHYFDRLETSVRQLGVSCPLLAMQSNGGTTSFKWAKEHPITLIESGPAAGINGATLIGGLCGEPNVIYLDIGGTTAKCSTIENGEPRITSEYNLERSRQRFGYPARIAVIDIVEIGAGGGSIASLDAAGSLRVGPVSAGAEPGPASYGRGGAEPTVTDAKLITGVLNPRYFAGGQLPLHPEKAAAAMEKIAAGLGCGVEEAAAAVTDLIDANMLNALKLISVQRGRDPRDFVLVVGGGGGPMHGAALGRELGVKEVIVPLYPGLFSAWGMLVTAPRLDLVRTLLQQAENASIDEIRQVFDELHAEAQAYFSADSGFSGSGLRFDHKLDLRYAGQEHSVTIAVDPARASVAAILRQFHEAHERNFTFALSDSTVELVSFRLTATAEVARPEIRPLDNGGLSPVKAFKERRMVYFGEEGRRETPIYERNLLPAGFSAKGPLIVEEASSTTLIYPNQQMRVDELGFLRIISDA